MQLLLPAIYFVVFLVLILKLNFFRESFRGIQLSALFTLKVIAGVGGFYLYTYYYPQSDALLFMEGSNNIFDRITGSSDSTAITGWDPSFDEAFFNSSRVMILINTLIRFISFDNVFVHILFFCFFSFSGLMALYKAFRKHFPDKNKALVIGVFFVPSVLFWTSGIHKEGVAVLCVGFIIFLSDFGLNRAYTTKSITGLTFFVVLLFFLKVYLVACLIPLLLINFLVSRMGERNYLLRYSVCFFLFVFAFHGISKVSPRVNFYQLMADKQAKAISESLGGIFLEDDHHFIRLNYNDSAALVPAGPDLYFIKENTHFLSWKLNNMKDTSFVVQNTGQNDPPVYKLTYKIRPANSGIEMKKMEPSFWGMLKRIPRSIATVFFQPTLFSIKNALQLFSWVENMWLLLVIALSLLFFDRKVIAGKEVILFCFLFGLFQFATIGLTSPVVGAIVRYKVTAVLFLFTVCLICIDGKKLMAMINRTKDRDSGKE